MYNVNQYYKAKGELMNYYNNETSYNTATRINSQFKVFERYCIDNKIFQFDENIFNEFVEYGLRKKHKESTINLYLSMFNKLLDFLDVDGVNNNRFELIKVNYKKTEHLTFDEFKELCRCMKNWGYTREYYAMIFFYLTGIKSSELKYCSIDDFYRGKFMVKNKESEREIIISDSLRNEMEKYIKIFKPRLSLFYSYNDYKVPYAPKILTAHMQECGQIVKIKENKCHVNEIRHLFATEYMKVDGNSIEVLSQILGHKSISTTIMYIHNMNTNSINISMNGIRF